MTDDDFSITVEIRYRGEPIIVETATAGTVLGIAAELEDEALVVGRAKESLTSLFIEGARHALKRSVLTKGAG